jgi:hypothetical protein
VAWCVLLAACGGRTVPPAPPPAPEPAPVAPKSEVLAVLPVAATKYPKVAAALDEGLRAATVPNTTPKMAPVSMEVVQLSIECVEASVACYAGVARSLEADQILFARISAGGNRGEVRVEVMRTNADGGTVGAATWTYKTEAEAIAEAKELVTRALGSGERGTP